MIFITLGTQNVQFERLLKEIDRLIDNKIICEKVIVQSGFTNYKSNNFETKKLLSINELNKLIKKADLIITHGGVGSILDAIKENKKVIAIPRLKEFNEAANNHQEQIINKFAELGYIKACNNITNLENIYLNINKFKPKKFIGNNKNFVTQLINYIDKN